MKPWLIAVLSVTSTFAAPPTTANTTSDATAMRLPILFEANVGQFGAEVDFLARGREYNLFLCGTEAVYTFRGAPPLRMRLAGASASARVTGGDASEARVHSFHGDDPNRWRADVPTFGRVECRDAYVGIDVVHHARGGAVAYDFVLAPFADPRQIMIEFDGALEVRIDEEGTLLLHTESGVLRHAPPVVCQEVDGARRPVDGQFVLLDDALIGFRLGGYDPRAPLVIDPYVSYATFVGGGAGDVVSDVAASQGCALVTGRTFSADFPTLAAIQSNLLAPDDAFVAKFDTKGKLVFATFIGGNGHDSGNGVTVAPDGTIWMVGETDSATFPTTGNAAQPAHAGALDGFYAHLSASGSSLLRSSYIGGSGNDTATTVDVNQGGNTFTAGTTDDAGSFPITYSHALTTTDTLDTWAAEIDPTKDGSISIGYSVTYGGSGDDFVIDGACGTEPSSGQHVQGILIGTNSTDLPVTANALNASALGGRDAAVAVFDHTGTQLRYGSYLGGSGDEAASPEGGLTFDENGNLVGAVTTSSTDAATTASAAQPSYGGGFSDAYFFELVREASSSHLAYATYVGGDNAELAGAVLASGDRRVVAGGTRSANFPVVDPVQAQHSGNGQHDVFLTVYDLGLITFSTVWGGNFGHDYANGIAMTDDGTILAGGVAESSQFPTTPGAFDTNADGFVDGFLFAVDPDATLPSIYGVGLAGTGGATPKWIDPMLAKPVYSGESAAFGLENLAPGSTGFLIAGVDDASQPIAGDATLLVDVTQLHVIVTFPVLVPQFALTIPVPNLSAEAEVFAQALFADPGAPKGVSATAGFYMPILFK